MRNLSAAYAPARRHATEPATAPAPAGGGDGDSGRWVKTSVSMRPAMRRRLRAWAALHDMPMQEVVDAALEAYLNE